MEQLQRCLKIFHVAVSCPVRGESAAKEERKSDLEFFFFFFSEQTKKYALVCITETLEGNRFSSSSNVSPCNHLVQPERHLSATRTHTHTHIGGSKAESAARV